MHHLATLLDGSYLARGLALQASIAAHAGDATLWVLCLDDAVRRALHRLGRPGVRTLDPATVLGDDLERVQGSRSPREYYFAAKAYLARHLLVAEGVDRATVIDGDTYVCADPRPVLDDLGDASVVLTAHRSGDAAFEQRFGRFNAGFVSFRQDDAGVAAAEWWVARCVEATPDYPAGGRFAEQKYLDDLGGRAGTVVLDHPGVNAAPWNLHRANVRAHGDGLSVDGRPLVLFHFQGAERWRRGVFAFRAGASPRDPLLRHRLHRPYAQAWERGVVDAASVGVTAGRVQPWGSSRPRPWWWRSTRVVVQKASTVADRRVLVLRDR